MRTVNLHPVESSGIGDDGGPRVPVDDVFDLDIGELTRRLPSRNAHPDGGRGHRLMLGGQQVGLSSRMIHLHPDETTAILGRLCPARQAFEVTVVLDDDVPRLTEMVVVDHHIAGHYEPVSPRTPAAEQLYESRSGPCSALPRASLRADFMSRLRSTCPLASASGS